MSSILSRFKSSVFVSVDYTRLAGHFFVSVDFNSLRFFGFPVNPDLITAEPL